MAIFIKCERLVSLKQLHRRVFISFICEKLLSTEAVATGMDRPMVASVFKFGNILLSISFHLLLIPSTATSCSLYAA